MQSEASSIVSRFSTIGGQRTQIRLPEKEMEFEAFLDNILIKINFNALTGLSGAELENELQNVDALELFKTVQYVTEELATVKLENHFITDFLEKNDPKLLIGLKQRRATATAARRSFTSSTGRSTVFNTRVTSRQSVITTQSTFTVASNLISLGSKKTDFRLNFRAKTEMAEKTAIDVEKRIRDMEQRAMNKIKMLNTRIEEMRYTCAETQETARNFELHFLKDARDIAFLETATERQLERKLRKFVNNWLKNGRALLGTMRLRITSLQDSCAQHRNDLMTKADLSGILRAVDFEQLTIKRDELLLSLEDKINHLNGLKAVTGKASLAMSEEKKIMTNIENESKHITNRTLDVLKGIAKLEREAKYVQYENDKDLKVLRQLQAHVERYNAPSVSEYIERKAELLALEKEEKLLKRKIYILNMKLTNALKRCKRRDDLEITV